MKFLFQIDILINNKEVEELTQVTHMSKARALAKHVVTRLKECLPAQLYDVALQGKIGGKVIARENIKARRKDVLAKCVSVPVIWQSFPVNFKFSVISYLIHSDISPGH